MKTRMIMAAVAIAAMFALGAFAALPADADTYTETSCGIGTSETMEVEYIVNDNATSDNPSDDIYLLHITPLRNVDANMVTVEVYAGSAVGGTPVQSIGLLSATNTANIMISKLTEGDTYTVAIAEYGMSSGARTINSTFTVHAPVEITAGAEISGLESGEDPIGHHNAVVGTVTFTTVITEAVKIPYGAIVGISGSTLTVSDTHGVLKTFTVATTDGYKYAFGDVVWKLGSTALSDGAQITTDGKITAAIAATKIKYPVTIAVDSADAGAISADAISSATFDYGTSVSIATSGLVTTITVGDKEATFTLNTDDYHATYELDSVKLNDAAISGSSIITEANAITVFATKTPLTYDQTLTAYEGSSVASFVSFEINDVVESTVSAVVPDTKIIIDTDGKLKIGDKTVEIVFAEAPAKTKYTFLHWEINAGAESAYIPLQTEFNVNAAYTLRAVVQTEYLVEFHPITGYVFTDASGKQIEENPYVVNGQNIQFKVLVDQTYYGTSIAVKDVDNAAIAPSEGVYTLVVSKVQAVNITVSGVWTISIDSVVKDDQATPVAIAGLTASGTSQVANGSYGILKIAKSGDSATKIYSYEFDVKKHGTSTDSDVKVIPVSNGLFRIENVIENIDITVTATEITALNAEDFYIKALNNTGAQGEAKVVLKSLGDDIWTKQAPTGYTITNSLTLAGTCYQTITGSAGTYTVYSAIPAIDPEIVDEYGEAVELGDEATEYNATFELGAGQKFYAAQATFSWTQTPDAGGSGTSGVYGQTSWTLA
jgi:hypothetical protein